MKYFFQLLSLLFLFSCHSEKRESCNCEEERMGYENADMVNEIVGYKGPEARRIVDSLFAMDSLNHTANKNYTYYLFDSAKYKEVNQFLQSLINLYPKNVDAYLNYAEFAAIPFNENGKRIKVYEKAFDMAPNYERTHRLISGFYYREFLRDTLGPRTYNATMALKYLQSWANVDPDEKPLLKYPIIQLAGFLKDTAVIAAYDTVQRLTKTNAEGMPKGNKYNWYKPDTTHFEASINWRYDASKNWRHSYTIYDNLLGDIKYLKWSQSLDAYNLCALCEPLLSNKQQGPIYRFYVSPSFYPPATISLTKYNSNYYLETKEAFYDTVDEKYVLEYHHKKMVSSAFVKTFVTKLKNAGYWNMPSTISGPSSGSTDGESWVLEAVENGQYKYVECHNSFPEPLLNVMEMLFVESGIRDKTKSRIL